MFRNTAQLARLLENKLNTQNPKLKPPYEIFTPL